MPLPKSTHDTHPLETLHRRCGAEIAGVFHDAFAGQELLMPYVIVDGHKIVTAVGRAAADILAEECGGVRWLIPSNRERRVIELFQAGNSLNEIAHATTLTTRGVRRLLRKLNLVRHEPRTKKSSE